jgi:hypothetical protein
VSPKHVTYDSVVTVRRSNSYEVQKLSGEEKDDMANNSVDYQSRIREMSEMIVKEYSSPEKEDADKFFVSESCVATLYGKSYLYFHLLYVCEGSIYCCPSHRGTVLSLIVLLSYQYSVVQMQSNFFRRVSPRMTRKQKKERGSKTSLSSRDSETGSQFSRGKVRQSFLNLLKRPKSKSKSKNREDENQHLDDIDGGFKTDPSSNRILKSIRLIAGRY